MYIDSIEKIWQKSLAQINFHWPWATGPLLMLMTGGFRGDLNVVFYQNMPNSHNRFKSAERNISP
jgi:hypothetical protein